MKARIENIGHRGAASLAPENTLAAARKALEARATMWELDVLVSADGVPVVFHDDYLDRTTNAQERFPDRAPWLITTFTLAELRSLDAGSWFVNTDPFGQIAAGKVSPADQASYRGEPIPTLREALLFTRDHNWRVNIELKKLPPPMEHFPVVEKVIALIEEMEIQNVLISSFELDWLPKIRARNPDIALAALLEDIEAETWPTDLSVEAYHPYYATISEAKIQSLRQAGFGVNPWTVNDEADMRRLIQAGVTGIITDYPQRLSLLLAEL